MQQRCVQLVTDAGGYVVDEPVQQLFAVTRYATTKFGASLSYNVVEHAIDYFNVRVSVIGRARLDVLMKRRGRNQGRELLQ